MQGFESSYRRHLAVEQRRAILEAIAETLDPEATVGDVLDAAERLGWGDQIGAFSLAEIATAMAMRDDRPTSEDEDESLDDDDAPLALVDEDDDDLEDDALEDDDLEDDDDDELEELEDDALEDEDDLEEEEEAEEEDEYTRNLRALLGPERLRELEHADEDAASSVAATPERTSKKGRKKKSKKAAKVQARKVEPEPVVTKAPKPARGKAEKAEDGRKRAARLRALRKKIDAEERMSLDEAAELFLPIVTELGQATMQDLEEFTGVGRRKLRFHVGQLVRHEYLERHGMGRGTYYTIG